MDIPGRRVAATPRPRRGTSVGTGGRLRYLSVFKALKHSCIEAGRRLEIEYVDSEKLADGAKAEEGHAEAWATVQNADGVVVPGGFGDRGVEGMIACAKWCREHRKPYPWPRGYICLRRIRGGAAAATWIVRGDESAAAATRTFRGDERGRDADVRMRPARRRRYLGVCLGMQVAVVEYARSVLGRAKAHSTEFDAETAWPTVIFMPEAVGEKGEMGGTMRLGSRDTVLHEDAWTARGEASLASLVYGGARAVPERHRHRYEVNPAVVPDLEKAGLRFVGKDDSGERMEIVELPRSVHPYSCRAESPQTGRGDAAAATRIVRVEAATPPRRRDAESPRRRVDAADVRRKTSARPQVLHGLPVPPRVQVAAHEGVAAVLRLRARGRGQVPGRAHEARVVRRRGQGERRARRHRAEEGAPEGLRALRLPSAPRPQTAGPRAPLMKTTRTPRSRIV